MFKKLFFFAIHNYMFKKLVFFAIHNYMFKKLVFVFSLCDIISKTSQTKAYMLLDTNSVLYRYRNYPNVLAPSS